MIITGNNHLVCAWPKAGQQSWAQVAEAAIMYQKRELKQAQLTVSIEPAEPITSQHGLSLTVDTIAISVMFELPLITEDPKMHDSIQFNSVPYHQQTNAIWQGVIPQSGEFSHVTRDLNIIGKLNS